MEGWKDEEGGREEGEGKEGGMKEGRKQEGRRKEEQRKETKREGEREGGREGENQILIRREVSWKRVTINQSHFFPLEFVVSPQKCVQQT